MDDCTITPFLRRKYLRVLDSAEYRTMKQVHLYGFKDPLLSVLEETFEDFVCIASTGYPRHLLDADDELRKNFWRSEFAREAYLRVKALCSAETPQLLEKKALKIFNRIMVTAIRVPTEGCPASVISPNALEPVLKFNERPQRKTPILEALAPHAAPIHHELLATMGK
jgi:hypothetical protein